MKVSMYNYILEIEDQCYVFNTVTDSYILISDQIRKCMESGDLSRIGCHDLEILMEGHFVVPDWMDEFQSLIEENENSNNSTTYNLTLLPTLDCNVNCWYCFEKHIKGSRLHDVVRDAILEHVKTIFIDRPQINTFIIDLFGGEPFLFFEEDVYPLLSEIKRLMDLENKVVKFRFVTNGLCINKEIVAKLSNWKTGFQISIDGYKNKHDTIKKIQGNEELSSYDEVMKNILLLASSIDTKILLRINYDSNTLTHISEVIDSIKQIPRNKIDIHLERVWQTVKRNKSYNLNFKRAIDTFIENGFNVTYLNFSRKSYSCKAGQVNEAVITYNGDVYKCTGRDFTPETKEGILKTDGTVKWISDKINERLSIKTYDNVKCRECKMLPLCWGPCCQKQLESKSNGKNVDDWCQLNNLEISIDDFLFFRMKSKLNKLNI